MDSLATTFQTVASLLSAGAAVYLVYLTLQFRRHISRSESVQNLPEILIDRYLQREMTKPYTVDGTELKKLKALRNEVLQRHRSKSAGWKEVIETEIAPESLENGVENRLAYELSLALDEIGVMVMTGSLPLGAVIELAGIQILEDWTICRELVKKRIRRENPVSLKSEDANEPLHRVHAEWLAMIIAARLEDRFEGDRVQELLEMLGSPKDVRDRVVSLSEACEPVISDRIGTRLKEIGLTD